MWDTVKVPTQICSPSLPLTWSQCPIKSNECSCLIILSNWGAPATGNQVFISIALKHTSWASWNLEILAKSVNSWPISFKGKLNKYTDKIFHEFFTANYTLLSHLLIYLANKWHLNRLKWICKGESTTHCCVLLPVSQWNWATWWFPCQPDFFLFVIIGYFVFLAVTRNAWQTLIIWWTFCWL